MIHPHFSLPFRLQGVSFAENEQDSPEDIVDCAEAVLRFTPGDREMLPEFGTQDLTFMQQPVDPKVVVNAVATWEPRAHVLARERPDLLDTLVDHLIVEVSTTEPGGG